jgi:hypothetical protein
MSVTGEVVLGPFDLSGFRVNQDLGLIRSL